MSGDGRLWGGRFNQEPAEAAWELGSSTAFDRRLWRQDIDASRAHARELARIGVLETDEAARIEAALDECAGLFTRDRFPWEPTDEDLHGAIERWLVEQLGPLGGKLRAGRSRNDQISNDLRLWVRGASAELGALITDLQEALVDRAEEHLDWLAPGYTHLQRGQPVLLAHHLLAYVWMLDRDSGRLRDAADRADESVLGAGALAGTTLDLDPERYAETLGYARVAANSIDAVASRDFVVEALAACALLSVHVSRLAEEMVLWTSTEFGFARLGDAFSTGSSIMPQKRNPDVAELARGKAGRVIGDLVALLTVLKGLPLAYDRDLQEDKEPVFDAVDTLRLVLPAMSGAVRSLRFDRDRLEDAAADPAALATDLAEELVRRGVPFREAHDAVGELLREADRRGIGLDELPAEEIAGVHPAADRSVAELLDPRTAVERRTAPFATSSTSVATQIARAREAIARNRSGPPPPGEPPW